MKKPALATVLGFTGGVLAGFLYGQKTKSRIGEAVSTDVAGGVVTVRLDTKHALRAGLPDALDAIL